MKRRAECRRRRRYAAKGRVDPRLHDHLEDQRVLPSDHPNRDDVPLLSTRARGSQLLQVVRRTKVAQSIQRRLNGLIDLDDDMRLLGPRPGPQSMVTVEMMLLAILIAADLKKSYRRTDISRVLLGLHAEVAMAVGLIDGDSNLIVPPYKVLAAQLLRMERALREGWTSEAEKGDEVIEHDLQWLINRFVEHSVPNGELRTITNITVDDTDITAWGEWNKNASIKEAEDDPVVKYLKKSLDVPDLDEPTTQTISKNTQKAIRKGLEIGPDGRPIYGTDKDARAGHKSANSAGPAGPYNGYVGRVAVASDTIGHFREPNKVELYPVTPYIVGLLVDPGGTNPGPAGVRLAKLSRQIAPNINDVTADRGFTMKSKFLRELHKDGINVVMDYTKTVVRLPKSVLLGKRQHLGVMHCGTILAEWTPDPKTKPPDDLKRTGKESELATWYADRYRTYAYTPSNYYPDGSIQFRTPLQAGRITDTPATEESGTYSKPMLSSAAMGQSASYKTVKVPVAQLDHWQRIPYGTPAWHDAYYPGRSTVESAIGRLKDNCGLERANCQAMGLGAITLSMLALVVIYNLGKTSAKKLEEEVDPSGDECTRPPGTPSGSRSGRELRRDAEAPTRAPP